jgi:hypothetical protein
MKTFKVLIIILVVALIVPAAFSQLKAQKNQLAPKFYWTEFALATAGDCKIKIAPDDISPNEKDCAFTGHLPKGSKVKLKNKSDKGNWAKLIFEDENGQAFEIYLKNDSEINYEKALNLAFSDTEIEDDSNLCGCDEKTKLDLIKCKGFPSRIARKDETEIYYFGLDSASGQMCGFDLSQVTIKKGRITQVSGTI